MVSLDGSGTWGGLALDVADPRRPGLRMEAATGGRLLLRQGDGTAARRSGPAPRRRRTLLWFISGLECHVLLDGHHRLSAAIAEDHAPALLAPALRRPDKEVRELAAKYTRDYTRTVDRLQQLVQSDTPGAASRLARTHDQLARLLHGVAGQPGPTRAWPLPGGTQAWQTTAATIAPASSVSRPVQDPGEIEPAPEDRAV